MCGETSEFSLLFSDRGFFFLRFHESYALQGYWILAFRVPHAQYRIYHEPDFSINAKTDAQAN